MIPIHYAPSANMDIRKPMEYVVQILKVVIAALPMIFMDHAQNVLQDFISMIHIAKETQSMAASIRKKINAQHVVRV